MIPNHASIREAACPGSRMSWRRDSGKKVNGVAWLGLAELLASWHQNTRRMQSSSEELCLPGKLHFLPEPGHPKKSFCLDSHSVITRHCHIGHLHTVLFYFVISNCKIPKSFCELIGLRDYTFIHEALGSVSLLILKDHNVFVCILYNWTHTCLSMSTRSWHDDCVCSCTVSRWRG